MNSDKLTHLALLLNRLTLGVLFVFAGIRKVFPGGGKGPWQAMQEFAGYVASNAPLPEALGRAYGYALPWGEILFGLLLMLGFYTRLAAVVIGLMLISFMLEFGIAWWPKSGPAFDKNVIYLTLAFLLAVTGGGRYALEQKFKLSRKGG
ncbi:MAG: DoxX family protein [Planctomycetota bacterium]